MQGWNEHSVGSGASVEPPYNSMSWSSSSWCFIICFLLWHLSDFWAKTIWQSSLLASSTRWLHWRVCKYSRCWCKSTFNLGLRLVGMSRYIQWCPVLFGWVAYMSGVVKNIAWQRPVYVRCRGRMDQSAEIANNLLPAVLFLIVPGGVVFFSVRELASEFRPSLWSASSVETQRNALMR